MFAVTFKVVKKAPFMFEVFEFKMKGHLLNLNPILDENAAICSGVIKQPKYTKTRPSASPCGFLSSLSTGTYDFFTSL